MSLCWCVHVAASTHSGFLTPGTGGTGGRSGWCWELLPKQQALLTAEHSPALPPLFIPAPRIYFPINCFAKNEGPLGGAGIRKIYFPFWLIQSWYALPKDFFFLILSFSPYSCGARCVSKTFLNLSLFFSFFLHKGRGSRGHFGSPGFGEIKL